jgi:hypothetical protein
LESRQSRRLENREGGKPSIKSSLSNLATLLAAKEEDDARHSLPIEKVGLFMTWGLWRGFSACVVLGSSH